ncbi:thiamine pyrophosphate-dependent enzyme [Chloroflexota bacterium]
MSTILGAAGTKTFWQGTNDFFYTRVAGCRSCGSELAAKLVLRTIYETTPNAMVFGRSCGAGRSELQTGGRIGGDGSGLSGMWAAMQARGIKDKSLVVMSGDGRTLELGASDFIGTFDREVPITWIVLDNQAHSASGSAATKTTPLKAMTRIYSRETGGKPSVEMNMPMMMIFGKARYVATASAAYVRDLVIKVQEALQNKPSYIHINCPCMVSWMYSADVGIKLSRLAVQTGYFPLWSFKKGVFRRTVKIAPEAMIPVTEWLELQGRYANLTDEDIKRMEEHIRHKNALVDALESSFSGPETISY